VTSNDVVLLNNTIARWQKETGAHLKESEYFELFCSEQILKDSDLSYDELLTGIVDASDDGGIDSVYVFADGELVDDDTEFENFRRQPRLELYIIQSKQSPTFAETVLDKLIASCANLFDLTQELSCFSQLYNQGLIARMQLFRTAYLELSALHASLSINCIYASKGDIDEIHPKVQNKSETLKRAIENAFVGSEVNVQFWGARQLLAAAQKQKSYTLQLRVVENPISTGEGAYVALANLKDYGAFVTDQRGILRKYIFESNVRDYQGDVDVNADIRKSLEDTKSNINFWWLNNGITVIASKATIAAKTITLDDVQVVNGLQTTTSIYNYLTKQKPSVESRSVLLKIIETNDPETRDRIIKATNYQTAIPPASLKATDRIQRDIEAFLLDHGWFYDRRKNYHKNQGKPLDKIVSIPYLAQAIMAIVLREPDNSRARPSTLIKRDTDYARVFKDGTDLRTYLACIEIMKEVDDYIRGTANTGDARLSNLRFHIAMVYAIKLLQRKDYSVRDLVMISESLTKGIFADFELLEDSDLEVAEVAREFQKKNGYGIDRTAKSREFCVDLIGQITPGRSPSYDKIVMAGPEDGATSKSDIRDEDIPF
jgi:hypothetical protein